MRRHRRIAVVLATLIAFCTTQRAAYAVDPYTRYAVAFETGYTDLYAGASTTRTDPTTSVPACVDPATGYLESIYQPLWVRWSYGWIESGTGHECNSRDYWYVYLCGTGACGFVYTQVFSTNGTHTHSIRRTANTDTWTARRDGASIFTVHWGNLDKANRIDVGLESHAPTGSIPSHKDTALKFSTYDGALQAWAGFDGKSVDPPACGGWNTASEWRSAFPAGSC